MRFPCKQWVISIVSVQPNTSSRCLRCKASRPNLGLKVHSREGQPVPFNSQAAADLSDLPIPPFFNTAVLVHVGYAPETYRLLCSRCRLLTGHKPRHRGLRSSRGPPSLGRRPL